jgi:hypothetical protein
MFLRTLVALALAHTPRGVGASCSLSTCAELGWDPRVSGVCGESDAPPLIGCAAPVSLHAAKAVCEDVGARLCSTDELIRAANGTGCGFDVEEVWSATPCEDNDDDDAALVAWLKRAGKDGSRCTKSAAQRLVRCCADEACSEVRRYLTGTQVANNFNQLKNAIENNSTVTIVVASSFLWTDEITIGAGMTVNITNAHAADPVLDRNHGGRFFDISSKGTLIVSGLTFISGYTDCAREGLDCSGVANIIGTASFFNCTFKNNQARAENNDTKYRNKCSEAHGGVVNIGGTANASFANCVFEHNHAFTSCPYRWALESQAAGFGGVAFIKGTATATFANSVFKNNQAGVEDLTKGNGGVVFVADESTASFADCVFDDNYAANDGGVALIKNSGKTTFINCVFNNNYAPNGCVARVSTDLSYDWQSHSNLSHGTAEATFVQCEFNEESCATQRIYCEQCEQYCDRPDTDVLVLALGQVTFECCEYADGIGSSEFEATTDNYGYGGCDVAESYTNYLGCDVESYYTGCDDGCPGVLWRDDENWPDDESFGIGVVGSFVAAIIGIVFTGIMVGNAKQRSLDLQAAAAPA